MEEPELHKQWNTILKMTNGGLQCRGGFRGYPFDAERSGNAVRIDLQNSTTYVTFQDFQRLIEALESLSGRQPTTELLQKFGLNVPTYVLGLYYHYKGVPPVDDQYDALLEQMRRTVPA